jgi:hypothetical protein
LPRILGPAQATDCLPRCAAAATAATVLGSLRRCEVPGLRLDDLQLANRRAIVAQGLVPVSSRFFTLVSYLDSERLADAGTDLLLVALKGRIR